MANKNTLLQAMRQATNVAKKEVESVVKKDKPVTDDLKPIVALDGEGEKMFSMVLDHLSESGLLEAVDVVTCTMLAKNISMFVMLSREIQSIDDIVQVYDNGTSNVSGKMTALSKVQGEVFKLSAKLGLSPMDMSRMLGAAVNAAASNDKKSQGDAIDDILGG